MTQYLVTVRKGTDIDAFYNEMDNLKEITVSYNVGLYTPIGSIIFGILAGRYIKKDQKLVSSMDRLR